MATDDAPGDHAPGDAPVEETVLPRTAVTLSQARARLTGWHHAKESLSENEQEILYLAEGLLRLVDAVDPGGYRR